MTHPFNSVREDASISSRPEHRFRPFSVEWAHQPEIELLAWSRANDGDDADWASVIPVVTSHAAVTRDLETVEVVASVDDVALVERPVSSDESHVSDLSDFRPDDDTHVTALHEAGHALVAVAFGVKVESASIIPDQDSGGRVTVKLPPRPTERDCQPHRW